jgi:hypothetical protein
MKRRLQWILGGFAALALLLSALLIPLNFRAIPHLHRVTSFSAFNKRIQLQFDPNRIDVRVSDAGTVTMTIGTILGPRPTNSPANITAPNLSLSAGRTPYLQAQSLVMTRLGYRGCGIEWNTGFSANNITFPTTAALPVSRFWIVRFSYLYPAALLALLSFASAYVARRVGAERVPGLCRNCGYDLRATPNCCPECGTVPASVQGRAPSNR